MRSQFLIEEMNTFTGVPIIYVTVWGESRRGRGEEERGMNPMIFTLVMHIALPSIFIDYSIGKVEVR